jgi:hypothetical protein
MRGVIRSNGLRAGKFLTQPILPLHSSSNKQGRKHATLHYASLKDKSKKHILIPVNIACYFFHPTEERGRVQKLILGL